MIESGDMSAFLQRLAETVAWCRLHADISDPRGSLRTPVLRPSNLSATPGQWGHFDYDWDTPTESQAAVSALAEKRAGLLHDAAAFPEATNVGTATGRLLIASPHESDWSGLSEVESQGFLDVLDVPAWDTWVCYMEEAPTHDEDMVKRMRAVPGLKDWRPPTLVSYLLCWVPSELCVLVDGGIAVNPVECFFWAKDYRERLDTPFLRRLDAVGLFADLDSSVVLFP